MFDHVFTDAISAVRQAFDGALLERQAIEERFQMDMLLGDITWDTSYGLPGEGNPPRVQAHISFVWPTWSQTAFRAWYTEGELDELPSIEMEVVFRVQRLMQLPEPDRILQSLPSAGPPMGGAPLARSAASTETLLGTPAHHAMEVVYDGSYILTEETLADGTSTMLDRHMAALGGWISSALVRLGDVPALFHPPDEDDN